MPYGCKDDGGAGHIGANQEWQGAQGRSAGVTRLRLRGQWSAWTRDERGRYEHEVYDTRDQALDALRRKGWPVL